MNEFSQDWFALIFNLIGGVAIGSVMRGILRRQVACHSLFLLVWGAGFGGLPLIFGVQLLDRWPWFLALQLFIFAAAILVTALVPDLYLESFKSPLVTYIGIGGVMLLIGIGAGVSVLLDATDWLVKLVVGGIFALVGAGLFLNGLKLLMRDESL